MSAEELMLLNCGVGEDSESPLDYKKIQLVHPKGDQISQSTRKSTVNIHWKE